MPIRCRRPVQQFYNSKESAAILSLKTKVFVTSCEAGSAGTLL